MMDPVLNGEQHISDGKNTISKTVTRCGIIIIILGTIYSFMTASTGEYKYEFNFMLFMLSEFISCVGGILVIGLGEIIQLLDDIKHELKR